MKFSLINYILLAMIFVIQIFDKEDKFLFVQIICLLLIIIFAIAQWKRSKKEIR